MAENNNSAMAPQQGAIAPQEGGNAPRNPFQDLIGLPGIDSIEDIFDDADEGLAEGNPFAGNGAGGNPFGGGAGGGNPFAGGGDVLIGDGSTTLVSDESAQDPNMTFDFDGITGQSENTSTSFSADGLISPSGDVTMFAQGGSSVGSNPFGVLLDLPTIHGAEDIFGNVGGMGGENPFSGGMSDGGASGGNPFGGSGGSMSNPWEGWDPLTEGNPFITGDEPTVAAM